MRAGSAETMGERYAIRVSPEGRHSERYLLDDSNADTHTMVNGKAVAVWTSKGNAHRQAAYFEDRCNARLVRLVKKAPPPLAVGDEVVVRGHVRAPGPHGASVALKCGTVIYLTHENFERVKP